MISSSFASSLRMPFTSSMVGSLSPLACATLYRNEISESSNPFLQSQVGKPPSQRTPVDSDCPVRGFQLQTTPSKRMKLSLFAGDSFLQPSSAASSIGADIKR